MHGSGMVHRGAPSQTTLDQPTKLGNLDIKRQVTWGMSSDLSPFKWELLADLQQPKEGVTNDAQDRKDAAGFHNSHCVHTVLGNCRGIDLAERYRADDRR